MAAIKFDLAPASDVEGVRGKQESVGSLLDSMLLRQGLQRITTVRTGGVSLLVRAGIIRIALASLAITGVLAALVSVHTQDTNAAFSCALAAEEYSLQTPGDHVSSFNKWHGLKYEEDGNTNAFMQELLVDAIR